MDDDRVINVAWLLQSLDGDGNPAQGAINITEPVIACLESALAAYPDADAGAILRRRCRRRRPDRRHAGGLRR